MLRIGNELVVWDIDPQGRTTLELIMKTFKITSIATVSKILSKNNIQFQDYKKAKNDPDKTRSQVCNNENRLWLTLG